ncbi:multicopper oxidase family protein [Virgibacillus xinjiangensis]|uniref:Multicopper oxidase family protein n=1 Tax=Virgibacillus xinjiangensis TaxID=393090 RepID=A0ABV7CU17_9BACI
MRLQKFVDRLPIMDTLKPRRKDEKSTYYEVELKEVRQKLHRDLRPTRLWGYNGSFPGPTIEAEEGENIQVKWMNKLPDRHILPIDRSIHNVAHQPEVRTVTHLHGSVTEPESDGYPEAWFTRDFRQVGPAFEKEVYEYPNIQRATTLWYHDHAMGITRLNVYAGLVGMYLIRGKREKAMDLPTGKYEVPLVITDRSFEEDGSLSYPTQPDDAGENLPNPSIVPAFNGDTILVNGKVWPYQEVEPRKYRFRILNASNTRTYRLSLDSGQPIYQIGSDGGLLSKTIKQEELAIAPAERMDVIIDFSKHKDSRIVLKNDLGPDAAPEDETDEVMEWRVNLPLSGKDDSRIPAYLSTIPSLRKNNIRTIRNLSLSGSEDEYGRPLLLLDGRMWDDPITEKPGLGDTEIWAIRNLTNFPHPIHIHLVQFQVIDRQPFDLELYNEDGRLLFTGPPVAPEQNELGWKDTISAPSGQITRVIAKFEPFTGDYVWHCHILEHEDYDMMRPFTVRRPKE